MQHAQAELHGSARTSPPDMRDIPKFHFYATRSLTRKLRNHKGRVAAPAALGRVCRDGVTLRGVRTGAHIPNGCLLLVALLLACDRSQDSARNSVPPAAVSTSTAQPQPEPQPKLPPPTPPPEEPANQVKLGSPAPAFSLVDTEGKSHQLSEYRGKTVVLEWFNPDCPFVNYAHSKGELQEMAKQLGDDDTVWLSVNSNAPGKQGAGVERNRTARTHYGIQNAVLLDESGQVGRAYGAQNARMFLNRPQGHPGVPRREGIDNAPMGEVDAARPAARGRRAGCAGQLCEGRNR